MEMNKRQSMLTLEAKRMAAPGFLRCILEKQTGETVCGPSELQHERKHLLDQALQTNIYLSICLILALNLSTEVIFSLIISLHWHIA